MTSLGHVPDRLGIKNISLLVKAYHTSLISQEPIENRAITFLSPSSFSIASSCFSMSSSNTGHSFSNLNVNAVAREMNKSRRVQHASSLFFFFLFL